jgi:hypothetical protein
MKRILLGIASAMLVWNAAAYGWGSGGTSWPSDSVSLGDEFVTITVVCGGGPNPTCPSFTAPIGRRFLLHYVTITARGDSSCTQAVGIMHAGTRYTLAYMALRGDPSQTPTQLAWDNLVLNLPKPIRGEADDTLGVFRPFEPTGSCVIDAVFGIEYLR